VSRHERDLVSLMLGLLIVLLVGVFLVADLTDLSVDGRWVVPVLLIGVGAVGLLGTLRSRASEGRPGQDQHGQEDLLA